MKAFLDSHSFNLVEENTYQRKVIPKDQQVIDLYFSENPPLNHVDSGLYLFEGYLLKITDGILEIKINKAHNNDEFIENLENTISFFSNNEITSLFDYFLFKNQESTYENFFLFFKEDNLKYSKIKPYISKMKKLGLIFDTEKINKDSENEEFIAINCLDYIKFIPYSEFDENKRIDSYVSEIKEYYNENEDISQWIEINFRRHLRKNQFNSNEIYHIIDWMISLEDKKILKQNMPYQKALSKANDWVSNQSNNSKLESFVDIEGVDVITLENIGSYSLVKLVSKTSKEREGVKMKNCIGKFHTNNPNLYSVRYQGKRIASIDMDQNKIIKELKGPINKEVKTQYQNSVLKLLVKFGINPVENHRDLHNIGCSVYKIPIIENEQKKEIAFLGPKNKELSSSIISLFDLKTKVEADQIINDIVSQLDERAEYIKLQLQNFIKENYKTCPITNFLIGKAKGVKYFEQIEHFVKITDMYPILRTLLHKKIIESIESVKTQDFHKRIESSIISLMDHAIEIKDCSHKEKVKMFLDLINIEDLSHLKAHGFFYSSKKIIKKNSIYSNIHSQLGLDSFNEILEDVKYFQKISAFHKNPFSNNTSFDFSIPKEADSISYNYCKFCDNENIYSKYNDLVEEFNNKRDDLESLTSKAEDLFEFVDGTIMDCFDFITKIRTLSLEFIKINQDGEIEPSKIGDLKNLLIRIDEILQYYEKNKMSKNFFSEIEEFEELCNKIIDCHKELDDISYKANKLVATNSDCEGCSHCTEGEIDGDNEDEKETCPKCDGRFEACESIDLKEIESPDSSKFEKNILGLSRKDSSIFSPFKIDWIISMRTDVNNFCDNAKDSKRLFIELIQN